MEYLSAVRDFLARTDRATRSQMEQARVTSVSLWKMARRNVPVRMGTGRWANRAKRTRLVATSAPRKALASIILREGPMTTRLVTMLVPVTPATKGTSQPLKVLNRSNNLSYRFLIGAPCKPPSILLVLSFASVFLWGQDSQSSFTPRTAPLRVLNTEYRFRAGDAVMLAAPTETLEFVRTAQKITTQMNSRGPGGFIVSSDLRGTRLLLSASLRTPPGSYSVDLKVIGRSAEARTTVLSIVLDPMQTVPATSTVPPVVLMNGYQPFGCLTLNIQQCFATC